jgi:hypothetical protein
MTRYSKTMGEALLEVRNPLIEDNVNLMRKASKGAMQTMKMKDGKVKMDSFTASAIMSIYDNVNSKNKNKIEDMITNGKIADLIKLQKFAMSKVSGSSRKSKPAFTGNSGIRAGYNEELEIEFDNMFVSEAESGNPDDQYDDEEERQVTEGKMKELHGYIKDGKTAEQIAKLMKLDVKTIKSLMAGYNEELDLGEGTWAMPDSSKKLKGLMQVLKRPIPLGKGGDSAVSVIRDFIGDDELYDDLGDAGDKNPKGDARPIIMKAMKRLKITQKNAEVEMDEHKGDKPHKHPHVDEGAAADARRAIGRDKDLGRKRDSADDDNDASDDDVKAASKNIMMQLRKAQSLRGKFEVEFMDRKKVKVDSKVAQAATAKYMALQRPAEKQAFQNKISKSYRDMLKALKEDYIPIRKTILDRIDEKLMERKND